jgi:hypothetical protein
MPPFRSHLSAGSDPCSGILFHLSRTRQCCQNHSKAVLTQCPKLIPTLSDQGTTYYLCARRLDVGGGGGACPAVVGLDGRQVGRFPAYVIS